MFVVVLIQQLKTFNYMFFIQDVDWQRFQEKFCFDNLVIP